MSKIRHGGFFDIAEWIVRINRRMDNLDRVEIPDFIGARYTTNAGQSINTSSTTRVDFEDEVYDTHDAVTVGGSWKFTAPIDGYYHVTARVLFTSSDTWAENEVCQLVLYKNGGVVSYLDRRIGVDTSGGANNHGAGGSDTIYLTASQYIDVRVTQTSGGTLTLHNDGAHNFIAIEKVG